MLDFLVIGAQKSGTTWLFDKLKRHRQISFPGGKEVHFWDMSRSRGLDWYTKLHAVDDGRIHGDMTPAYAALPVETIEECHSIYPNLRLIFSMRNPIERAWSAAKMDAVRRGMNPVDVPDDWFISHFNGKGSLARGDYERCIRNWLRFYPRERLLLLRFEDIAAAPESYLEKCCKHLGVDPYRSAASQPNLPLVAVGVAGLRERVREGVNLPLRASLRSVLEDLYVHRIRSLAAYLGEDLDCWMPGDRRDC